MTHTFKTRKGHRIIILNVKLDAGISRREARSFLRQSYPEYKILD